MKVTLSSVVVLAAIHLAVLVSTTLAQSCGNGDLRLRGTGSTRLQGRMEVCYNNEWGTVCHSGFGDAEGPRAAMVACRQLGFSDQGAQIRIGTQTEDGTGPINLQNVINCVGGERALIDCPMGPTSCSSHNTDAGVICVPQEDCIDGTVRLVNGSVDGIEGRVEVCANRTWSTVLGSNWGDEEATVLCRQLGYSDIGATAVLGGLFGMRIGPILDIQCTGDEDSLDSCTVSNSDRNYNHSNDAGVICLPLFVDNLCTNQSFFDSVCRADSTDTTSVTTTRTNAIDPETETTSDTTSETTAMTTCTCPTGTSPNPGTPGFVGGNNCTGTPTMDNLLPAVLGALLGITVIILICVVIGWIITCILMKRKQDDSKRTYDLTESIEATKEFKNPTYGTSDTLPTRLGNGDKQEYEGPTYDVAGPTTTSLSSSNSNVLGNTQQTSANPNPQPVYSTADDQPELTYDTPDYNDRGPNGVQGGEMYGKLDDDRSGPEGPIQSRPRENVDMSNVEEYGKLRR